MRSATKRRPDRPMRESRSGAMFPSLPTRRPARRFLSHPHVLDDSPDASPTPRPHDVEVASRIAPDAVARAKARIAPLGQSLTLEGQDADEAAVVLGDVDDVVGVDIEDRRPDESGGP